MNEVPQPPPAATPLTSPMSPDLRLLLVEDHEQSRQTLARLLVHHGFIVATAASVAEAKRLAVEEDHFNLMISDIGLPDGTGIQLMERLRRKSPGLPGIALTANNSACDIAASTAAGFVDHIAKPVNFKVLVSSIRKHVSLTQH